MCFTITPALREYFHYQGISADLERRGFGSSRPQLAWAIRQKQHEPENRQTIRVRPTSEIQTDPLSILEAGALRREIAERALELGINPPERHGVTSAEQC
jgi:hypothetical protein